ncbi:DUF2993 domain-containing protein [Pleurocapsa sp. PCC 7319]|uniref:LmeA family phospholipid-binding protein n=1 Tax=Pleurocapsa sp. PCC 7319 TaxID=118161 RepID=UPI0003486875|nr:DUF2993 domain-containing protein [Pleurocapsa sp. PCC 7319]
MKSAGAGEQAINNIAKAGIEATLDNAESLEVDLHSNPLDLMQGEIDSVSVKGEGLVMQKELRADKLRIETNDISINSIKAAMGNIELSKPTDARMLVVLKETDLQNAFNCEYVRDKLQNLKIDLDGEQVTAKIEQVNFLLPDIGKVKLEANVHLVETDQNEKISLTAIPEIDNEGNCINLKSIEYLQDTKYNTAVAKAIIDSAEEILDLRNFELDTMSLRVRKLDVNLGKLTIEADAEITDFPNA